MKKSILQPHIPFQSPELKDAQLVIEILIDCLKNGEDEVYGDVLTSHIATVATISTINQED